MKYVMLQQRMLEMGDLVLTPQGIGIITGTDMQFVANARLVLVQLENPRAESIIEVDADSCIILSPKQFFSYRKQELEQDNEISDYV